MVPLDHPPRLALGILCRLARFIMAQMTNVTLDASCTRAVLDNGRRTLDQCTSGDNGMGGWRTTKPMRLLTKSQVMCCDWRTQKSHRQSGSPRKQRRSGKKLLCSVGIGRAGRWRTYRPPTVNAGCSRGACVSAYPEDQAGTWVHGWPSHSREQ